MGAISSLGEAQTTVSTLTTPEKVSVVESVVKSVEHTRRALPWQFFCDSDFACNTEEQNRRRSQNGYIITCDGAPVHYGSKVSSIAFAHPDIGESHADISSGANEIYAAGNATQECLHLSYVVDEMGMDFPQPSGLIGWNSIRMRFLETRARIQRTSQRR